MIFAKWLMRIYGAWSRFISKKKLPPGITIGDGVWIGKNAKLDWDNGRHITISNYATIADGARILCHDASSNRRIGITYVAPVNIGERAFIGAESIILPGVRIGADAIVAAGSVVTSDVEPGVIVAGSPAVVIGKVADLDAQRKQDSLRKPSFDVSIVREGAVKMELHERLKKAEIEFGGYYLISADHRSLALTNKGDFEPSKKDL